MATIAPDRWTARCGGASFCNAGDTGAVRVIRQASANSVRLEKKADIDDRYQTIAGSVFDVDFGSNYDPVLLRNFLHHFDEDTWNPLLAGCEGS
jgi:hypothetical protein